MDIQIEQDKMNYLIQHMVLIKNGMMDKLENSKTILYAIRNILISSDPLEKCPDYLLLEEYFKMQGNYKIEKLPEFSLIQILSTLMQFMNKAHDEPVQKEKILSYYAYIPMEHLEQNCS